MASVMPAPSASRLLLSGNEAVARAVWESGCKVAAAYPGTPSTEMLEVISTYPEIYSEWSVNEKVALEVAIGAAYGGSRAFCAMKHVGMNVASDALMTLTLTGVAGGLVIAIADDVGLSSSQNEQDSRFWGRFAHVPVLEPADSQEAYEMTKFAYELSEKHQVPVILRMTTRINHVKGLVSVGERIPHANRGGFQKDASRWVMTPAGAMRRIPLMFERDKALQAESEASLLNFSNDGKDRRVGFVASGPAYMHVREAFPAAPVFKLGLSFPAPIEAIRAFARTVERLVVVEEVEPLVEKELKSAGIDCHGKDLLPKQGELAPNVLKPAIARLLGEPVAETPGKPAPVFPRPPTMCVACPHLGVYYTLSQIKNLIISGDIGCYTLGAGQPWNALDTCISMGASMGIAHGLDKGRGEADKDKRIVAVIGDSTFLHMGMQGLLDIVYNRGNVTVLILDNRAVGMTGGQPDPGSGRDIHGEEAPRVDFAKLVEALGVKKERIHVVDPYQLPVLFKTIREEIKIPEVSVIITNQPCVLIDDYKKQRPYAVIDEKCTGCGNCVEVGCPAIHVVRRDKVVKPSGKEIELQFVRIETSVCTGCGLCVQPCAPEAIVPADPSQPIRLVKTFQIVQ